MRRAAALLGLLALLAVGCGKYGPPVRTRPAPAATAPAAGAAAEAPEEEEEGKAAP